MKKETGDWVIPYERRELTHYLSAMSALLLEISDRQKPPPNDGAPKAQRSKYTAFYVFFSC
jgi:hypothetical protein